MKRNKYQTFIEVDKGIFLYFNSFSSKYLLLDEKKHNIYQNSSLEYIKQNYEFDEESANMLTKIKKKN